LWQQTEDLTLTATREPSPPQAKLRLRCGGRELIVGDGRDAVRLGREKSCDVVIGDLKASRQHARIERRRDKFILIDVSSNGTFVTFHGEPETPVKREEIVLRGRGSISFGHPYRADQTEVAGFDVETSS